MRSGKQVAPEGLIGIEAEEMKTHGGVRYRSRAEVFPRCGTERARNEAEEGEGRAEESVVAVESLLWPSERLHAEWD